jgi:hypothetical protein
LAKLVAAGLGGTGIGFAGAGIYAGPGPRTVHGALTLGPLYLPPLLVALAALALAALAATRIRWAAGAAAAFAAILLTGSVTFGAAAISYRMAHPAAAIPFAEDSLQLLGEAIATGAGIAALARLLRQRKAADRHTSQQAAAPAKPDRPQPQQPDSKPPQNGHGIQAGQGNRSPGPAKPAQPASAPPSAGTTLTSRSAGRR